MTTYSLDLGFEREALPNPSNRGLPLLQSGITKIGKVGNPVYILRQLKISDKVKITIYDLSEKKRQIDAMSFRIQFWPARAQNRRSPERAEVYERFKIFPREKDNFSTVWQETLPAWDVKRTKKGPLFGADQLQPSGFFNGRVFKLSRTGAFYFTMKLFVRWACGYSTTYRVDPEMICSGEGR